MRLTLRTLLAYMDDILDPQDQADISQQVDESDKAAELIHRTRDSMRRLRLGAPPVIGEGTELDPNCVAEYLDNTMPAEQMTDFQQVCLDSEVHLAEVASCHHILTMVLGEPAEIEPEMRQRMYTVPQRVQQWRQMRADGPHRVADVGGANDVARELAHSERPAEVPDYLRASERASGGRWALACAVALLLGALGYLSFGPGGWLSENAEITAAPSEPEVGSGAAPMEPPADEPETPVPPAGEPNGEESAVPAAPLADEADVLPGAPIDLPPVASGDPPVDSDAPAIEPDVPMNESDALPSAEAAVLPDVVETLEEGAAIASPMPDSPSPDAIVAVVPETLPGVAAPVSEEMKFETGGPADDVVTEGGSEVAAPSDVAPTAPSNAPLGTLVGQNQVLLRFDDTKGEWRRLPPRSSIASGDRLLSLPTYRPSLALVSGLRVEFSDGAMVTLDYSAVAEEGVLPRLEVTYGRFLLQNTSKELAGLELVIGDEAVEVQLESTAVLGIDVDRPFVPGVDSEDSIGRFAASFYAPVGKLLWGKADASLPISEPAQWTWKSARAGDAPASLTDEVDWLNGQSLDYLEEKISRNLEKALDSERPARQQLLEYFENARRREEKSLAALSSTHVGQFIPFVVALADTQQQSNWNEHIAHLRQAMSRSPEAAQLVRETLVEQRGAEVADDLFEMLRGYRNDQVGNTAEELKTGITRRLIDLLDHDRLEYRVLAFYNLREIYGGKSLNYNPVNTEPKRRKGAISTWRKRLADNDLKPVAWE
ncbi:MAG: hypothetical protein ACR2NU_11055 [Aeoliella sp.]